MLTIAYIGNGKSANRYHLPFALKLKDKIKVKTIYSRSGRQAWTPIDGVHYTTNLDDIYHDPEIQLVVVSTPSPTHFQVAKDVLMHDKNVLVEKPFTETVAEAEALFELARSRGLFIQCYQNRRYDSDYLTVKNVLASGKIGDPLEMEMHFDYFRPEVPTSVEHFSIATSYLYGHACHTLDQVIALFGRPDATHYDVRQLLGPDRMNDYFDIDLYYDALKVSVKSSYFRIKPRPSFVVYGKKGMFIKADKDRQETDLKHFYLPDHADFGLDQPENYGTLTYIDDNGQYHEERVVSEVGDYSRVYEDVYQTIVNGRPKVVKDEETLLQIQMLEKGIQACH
ncbi:Gfo/Idh/MocA family oxidoreductase [Lactiplantibacillus plajomi]|uniref:Gfo/Idh/MocA family oxidoreductase n=1 Tax=Lactiplantibacillus plajomi TaxID=1457217 RepID=A0ABV6K0F1_9LACO|nr:Gfo/Idh/MocA family oxidoreductase [Lactiplantibacillus plajomi]